VRALTPFRAARDDRKSAAVQTLRQTALLAVTAFPHSILPNPLVREMGALAGEAGLSMPLVEEVAADIFMGTFTTKWRRAATVASEVMAGSLYARYYDLPAASVWESRPTPGVPRWRRRRWGKETADDFATLCVERAKEAQGNGKGSFGAVNGTVLEQSQILTTHNLATLIAELDLRDRLAERAPDLADATFGWIVRRLSQPWREYHSTLQAIKNAAYAWRQAIFLLSLCEPESQQRLIERLRDQVPTGHADRFGEAVDGLSGIAAGARFGADGRLDGGPGRRFLGWSVGRHWLTEDLTAPQN
jgi:hypothetical protein